MTRLALLLPIVVIALGAAPAAAADRTVTIGSFERIRVQGPFEVIVAAGHGTGAVISGDEAAIGRVEATVDGGTLTVRDRIGRWEEQPRAAPRKPVVVRVGSDRLAGASVVGGGRIRAERMKAPRVDLAVTGAGAIAVGDVEADSTVATVIGGGALTLAGRSGEARLMTNGAGTIEAGGFDVGDLTVRLDGPGTTSARARFTARVTSTGLGQVSVAGNPKCTVTANAGGPVSCGTAR